MKIVLESENKIDAIFDGSTLWIGSQRTDRNNAGHFFHILFRRHLGEIRDPICDLSSLPLK